MSITSCLTAHMRLSGVYWGVTAMALLGREAEMDRTYILQFVMSCYNPTVGGFAGNDASLHDVHLLYTSYALLILVVYDALDTLTIDMTNAIGSYVASRQNKDDGSFGGDEWNEIDVKFTYCALSVLSLLHQQDRVDVPLAMTFVASCRNFDCGFGNLPGCESHGGHIFTALASLSLGSALAQVRRRDVCSIDVILYEVISIRSHRI